MLAKCIKLTSVTCLLLLNVTRAERMPLWLLNCQRKLPGLCYFAVVPLVINSSDESCQFFTDLSIHLVESVGPSSPLLSVRAPLSGSFT